MFVRYQMFVVIAANDVGVGKGNGAFDEFLDIALAFGDNLADMRHALAGILDFPKGFFVGVEVEKREADV
jgi:hypothetical protein